MVRNGSFENIIHCSNRLGMLNSEDWHNPNEGTPDLFCSCEDKKRGAVPYNSCGVQYPVGGKCYAGIFCYEEGKDRKEYLMYKLKHKLKKNKTYCLSFYYSHADYHKTSVKYLGALFTEKKTKLKEYAPISVSSVRSKIINDTGAWQKFYAPYKSTGKEKYMLIGSFENGNDFNEVHNSATPAKGRLYEYNYMAYYFFDNINLQESDVAWCPCIEKKDTLTIVADTIPVKKDSITIQVPVTTIDSLALKPLVLKNVNFQTNSSGILPGSFAELDSLVEHLREKQNMDIVITGHTDNVGDEAANLQLSKNRAKAVADYLIEKGINGERIKHEGYGSSRPLSGNETEEGRARNRRVEFLLIRN